MVHRAEGEMIIFDFECLILNWKYYIDQLWILHEIIAL